MKQTALLFSLVAAVSLSHAWAQPLLNTTPSRVIGQPAVNFRSANPNTVEGREFFAPWSVAVDTSSSPNAIYVADFGNNRVLGWRDAATFTNGAQADIVVGQVDKVSTQALGPGTTRLTGLSSPGSVAVDGSGNLYVADVGNNRILRFPRPFATDDEVKVPNMVIGQPGFGTDTANNGGVSERTLAFTSGSTPGRPYMAFDRQGNLWVTDPFNHRVLRFPVAALQAGTNQPSADLVLGQTTFTAVTVPSGGATQANRYARNNLRNPTGIAVDSEGRVFVADDYSRVLVYTGPYFNGKDATRLLGVGTPTPGQPLVAPNPFNVATPIGVFMIGERPAVVDAGYNRVLIWDPYSAWPAETEQQIAPPARFVLGQADFTSVRPNRGQTEPNEGGLNQPLAGAAIGDQVFIADTFNHRVVFYPQIASGTNATRVLGQLGFSFNAPNLVTGNELFVYSGLAEGPNIVANFSDGGGIAIDNRANPPRLYVADTFNNRVLGYRDVRRVRPGDRADIVIGQVDFNRTSPNAPLNTPSESTLSKPSGLAVDSNGDLFVADSGNARVLRFADPFAQVPAAGERYRANLVLGQSDFGSRVIDPSSRNMAYPFGMTFTSEGHLVVSDAAHHRVLFFRRPAGGDFTRGQAAERVIGQPDFFTATTNPTANNRLQTPRHVAVDAEDRLYVADAGKNRIAIYDRVSTVGIDPSPAFSLRLQGGAQGVYVNPTTGELWVADTKRNQASRYVRFEQLGVNQTPVQNIPSASPLALAQDTSGALYVVEGVNRVALYFYGLTHQTSGNYSEREISPGGIATLYPRAGGRAFSESTQSFNEIAQPIPLPRVLADTEVLVNNRPVPLYFVSPGQINFLVPMNTPDSGFADVQVIRASTGEVIAAGFLPLARVSPALFAATDQGQVAALNQDGTPNSPGNPARPGQVISLFGTGQGFVPNAPPDGELATGLTATAVRPRVLINSGFVDDSFIEYSGLAPSLVGVWQINVRIPESVPTRNDIDVVVEMRSVFSNSGTGGKLLRTTIAVRQ